jgi:hypothetical protein
MPAGSLIEFLFSTLPELFNTRWRTTLCLIVGGGVTWLLYTKLLPAGAHWLAGVVIVIASFAAGMVWDYRVDRRAR